MRIFLVDRVRWRYNNSVFVLVQFLLRGREAVAFKSRTLTVRPD